MSVGIALLVSLTSVGVGACTVQRIAFPNPTTSTALNTEPSANTTPDPALVGQAAGTPASTAPFPAATALPVPTSDVSSDWKAVSADANPRTPNGGLGDFNAHNTWNTLPNPSQLTLRPIADGETPPPGMRAIPGGAAGVLIPLPGVQLPETSGSITLLPGQYAMSNAHGPVTIAGDITGGTGYVYDQGGTFRTSPNGFVAVRAIRPGHGTVSFGDVTVDITVTPARTFTIPQGAGPSTVSSAASSAPAVSP